MHSRHFLYLYIVSYHRIIYNDVEHTRMHTGEFIDYVYINYIFDSFFHLICFHPTERHDIQLSYTASLTGNLA